MRSKEEYMDRCLKLAANGRGRVAPNPLVGCVIVHNDTIIGEGFHRAYGEPHAEVNAIHNVSDSSLYADSTLYVNLEPCAHHGKTPPCADFIISKGIQRVVVGSIDPNPLVAGGGIAKLRAAGVEVSTHILEPECRHLNRRFFTFIEKQRPYVILKWARSRDGYMDRKRSEMETGVNWITGDTARILVHQWRAEEAALLVGKNTVRNDDPQLTVRLVTGKNPLRVVMDKRLDLESTHRVFNSEAQTIVFNAVAAQTVSEHLKQMKIPFDGTEVKAMLENLHLLGIQSVMVEGGLHTLQSFIATSQWDEARILTGDVVFDNGLPAPEWNLLPSEQYELGKDQVSVFYNR